MSAEDKLAQGQHQTQNYLKFMGFTGLVACLSFGVYLVKKDGLTFDSQQQKQEVLSNLPGRLQNHTDNKDIHMSFDEKKRLIIAEENQKMLMELVQKNTQTLEKVGGDLQEIKTIVRRKN